MRIIAKTFFGAEEVLAAEVESLGGQNIEMLKRAVSYEGDLALLYRSNIYLRSALRILKPIYTFEAGSEKALYDEVFAYDWTRLIGREHTLAIDSVVRSDIFTHSKYVALKTKDAIVDQIRKKRGYRPSVDVKDPDIRLNVHIFRNRCSISVDSSGDSLHKRGYRIQGHPSPINEALAAVLVMLTGWDKDSFFVDSMCGSGTIPMEAAMIATNTPPNMKSANFGFMRWTDFDRNLYKSIVKTAKESVTESASDILGMDINPNYIRECERTAFRGNMASIIDFKKLDFFKWQPERTSGICVINLPYDHRMEQPDIESFYAKVGDKMKKDLLGFNVWLLSANREALKKVGLRPSKKITLYNGPLEAKFQKFEVYEGTKKANKSI